MAKFQGMSDEDKLNDIKILNGALSLRTGVFGLMASRQAN